MGGRRGPGPFRPIGLVPPGRRIRGTTAAQEEPLDYEQVVKRARQGKTVVGDVEQSARILAGLESSMVKTPVGTTGDQQHGRGSGSGGAGDPPSPVRIQCAQLDDTQTSVETVSQSMAGANPQPGRVVGLLQEDQGGETGMGYSSQSTLEASSEQDDGGDCEVGVEWEHLTSVRRGAGDVPRGKGEAAAGRADSGSAIDKARPGASRTPVLFVGVWGDGNWQVEIGRFFNSEIGGKIEDILPPQPRLGGTAVVRRADRDASSPGDGRLQTVYDVCSALLSGSFEPPNDGRGKGRYGQFQLLMRCRDRAKAPVGFLAPWAKPGGRGSSSATCGRPFGIPIGDIPYHVFYDFPGGIVIVCAASAGWDCPNSPGGISSGVCIECVRRGALAGVPGQKWQ